MTLKPYTGPYADNLYHVVDDEGRVIRNASELEVELWEERQQLLEALLMYQQAVNYDSSGVKSVNTAAIEWAYDAAKPLLDKAKVGL